MWYGARWSDLLIIKLISSPCMAVKQSPEMPSIWVNVCSAMHCTIATWEGFWLDIASFLTTPFAGSHLNWSIKTSGDSLVACENQNLTSWPAGNIGETLETWTVEGRDVKLSDSLSVVSTTTYESGESGGKLSEFDWPYGSHQNLS